MLGDLFMSSIKRRVREYPQLGEALKQGIAPLGEHETVFNLISTLNRECQRRIADAVSAALENGQFLPMFDALSAVARSSSFCSLLLRPVPPES